MIDQYQLVPVGCKASNVPTKPGAYIFFGEDLKPLYAGCSGRLQRRFRGHKMKCHEESVSFAYRVLPIEQIVMEEQKLIDFYDPPYNKEKRARRSQGFHESYVAPTMIHLNADDLDALAKVRSKMHSAWGDLGTTAIVRLAIRALLKKEK